MHGFTPLSMHLDGDHCWPDLTEREWEEARLVSVAVLPNGTSEGRPSVTLRVETEDGRVFLAQTTLRLFATAARAFAAKYPDDGRP